MGIEMIWIASAVGLGLGLGVLGYFFSKAAYSLFTLSITAFVFGSSFIGGLMGIDTTPSEVVVPVGEEGGTSIGSFANVFYKAIDNMGMLPEHVQKAIIVFIVTFFLARLATWGYLAFHPKKTVVEDRAAFKKRVLAQYGYKDGELPY